MRLDSRVAQAKFDAEISKLNAQRETLRAWGVNIATVEYPRVDIVLAAKNPVFFSFPVQLSSPAGIIHQGQVEGAIPVLSARALGVRFLLDNFDMLPPSVSFLDPFSWEPLDFSLLPRPQVVQAGKPLNVLVEAHPMTRRPFLCLRGVREYHSHPQHGGDDWMQYRSSFGLFSLIERLWRLAVRDLQVRVIMRENMIVEVRWERKEK